METFVEENESSKKKKKKNPKFHHSFSLYLEKELLKIFPTLFGGTWGPNYLFSTQR